jgi:hypothetical protein
MSQSQPTSGRIEATDVAAARSRWLAANESASKIAASLFQEGSGYGDPDAREADVHRLQSAKDEAERLLHEYNDLDRRQIQSEMLHLQRSQRLATWASFSVAAAVGIATVVNIVVALLKQVTPGVQLGRLQISDLPVLLYRPADKPERMVQPRRLASDCPPRPPRGFAARVAAPEHTSVCEERKRRRGCARRLARVGSRRALLAAYHRGRVWEPSQGSHQKNE